MKKTKTSPKAKKVTPKAKKTAPKKKTQSAKAGSAKDPKKKKIVTPKVSKKESTHVIAVLDRSGSMSSVAQAAIDGFNEFLVSQKKLKDKATMSGVLFSDPHKIEALFDGKTL